MLTERLSDLRRQNLCLTNDDEFDLPESSRKLPPKEMKCFKCKQFGHLIADWPCWEGKPSNRWKYLHCNGFTRMDRHTKLPKKNESPSSSYSTRPVTDAQAKATIESNMKKISQLNRVFIEMRMDSEDDTSESESDDEELHRRIGRSNAFIAYESSENSLE